MNTNSKKAHMPITLRAKKSFLGRNVCRIVGEESGQGMIEYVIICTLIAAVCAVGVYFFGGTILNMFSGNSEVASGKTTDGAATVEAIQEKQGTLKADAAAHAQKFNKGDDQNKPFATK